MVALVETAEKAFTPTGMSPAGGGAARERARPRARRRRVAQEFRRVRAAPAHRGRATVSRSMSATQSNQSGQLVLRKDVKFNGVKVFSATMVADRDQLGEKVTAWIAAHPELQGHGHRDHAVVGRGLPLHRDHRVLLGRRRASLNELCGDEEAQLLVGARRAARRSTAHGAGSDLGSRRLGHRHPRAQPPRQGVRARARRAPRRVGPRGRRDRRRLRDPVRHRRRDAPLRDGAAELPRRGRRPRTTATPACGRARRSRRRGASAPSTSRAARSRRSTTCPSAAAWSASPRYVHYTSNETIYGTQWVAPPRAPAPLVCDASSDIFSRPLPLARTTALIYAGAQKNLGPSGISLVIARKDFIETGRTRPRRRSRSTAPTRPRSRCTTRRTRSASR